MSGERPCPECGKGCIACFNAGKSHGASLPVVLNLIEAARRAIGPHGDGWKAVVAHEELEKALAPFVDDIASSGPVMDPSVRSKEPGPDA